MTNLKDIPTSDLINELIDNRGYILAFWNTEDIAHICNMLGVDYTYEMLEDIAYELSQEFDAEQGMNWDIIRQHILDNYVNNTQNG